MVKEIKEEITLEHIGKIVGQIFVYCDEFQPKLEKIDWKTTNTESLVEDIRKEVREIKKGFNRLEGKIEILNEEIEIIKLRIEKTDLRIQTRIDVYERLREMERRLEVIEASTTA